MGRMLLEVRELDGRLVAERRATNIVLRGGAELVAKRFAGQANTPINRIGVGFGREAADVGVTALTGPSGDGIPAAALFTEIPPESFTVDTTLASAVGVTVASLFHPTVDLPDVSEAGLLADDLLYNQVVFEAVTLKVGQDITFFWEIQFPFGH
jgi:hypothetical protein